MGTPLGTLKVDHSKRQGFPRTERLRYQKDFARCVRQGKRFSSNLMTLCLFKSCAPEKRVAFSVSRRVGNAVVRCRVKRWLREAYRHNRSEIANNYGFDGLFIVHPECGKSSFKRIKNTMDVLLHKADLINI